jgi:hypothetical protein
VVKHVVEPCRSSDLPELFELFGQWYKFNPRMREREFFDWQFRDTPQRLSDAEYDFLVLRADDGRIVGCLGFVGFEFWHGGQIKVGGWTHNWYAEGQAGGGLDLLMRFMALVDHRFLVRLSDKSQEVSKLLKIPLLPAIPRWWAAIDALQVAKLFGLNDPSDQAIAIRSADLFRRNDAPVAARRVGRLDPEVEFCLDGGRKTSGVRRTGRYLNWRYVDIPKHDYRVIRTDRGLGVYRVETVMGTEATVIRLLEWTFDTEETAGALATVMAGAAGRNPILVDFHCTCRAIGRQLEPFGFISKEASTATMPDLFRPIYRSGGYAVGLDLPPHRIERNVDWDEWYITTGDSDIDRIKL